MSEATARRLVVVLGVAALIIAISHLTLALLKPLFPSEWYRADLSWTHYLEVSVRILAYGVVGIGLVTFKWGARWFAVYVVCVLPLAARIVLYGNSIVVQMEFVSFAEAVFNRYTLFVVLEITVRLAILWFLLSAKVAGLFRRRY